MTRCEIAIAKIKIETIFSAENAKITAIQLKTDICKRSVARYSELSLLNIYDLKNKNTLKNASAKENQNLSKNVFEKSGTRKYATKIKNKHINKFLSFFKPLSLQSLLCTKLKICKDCFFIFDKLAKYMPFVLTFA